MKTFDEYWKEHATDEFLSKAGVKKLCDDINKDMNDIDAYTKECKWLLEEDTCWESQCGQSFIFNDKGPVQNGFKYCPYCGGKMIETQ